MEVPREQASHSERWQIGALLALPLGLLAIRSDWIFPGLTHDPWIYVGYGIDPWRMLAKFHNMYYSSRLSIILPLAAAHSVLPPVTAHLLIHLMLYYISVFALYGLVRSEIGQTTAFVTALLMGTYYFFLEAIGQDYFNSFGIALFLSIFWLMSRPWNSRLNILFMMAAGASTVAFVTAYLAHLLLVPLAFANYAALRSGTSQWRRMAIDVLAFAIGAAALSVVFCLVAHFTMGDAWFLRPSFAFWHVANKPGSGMMVNGRSIFKFADPDWTCSAVWLALPSAVALASALGLLRAGLVRDAETPRVYHVWRALYLAQFMLYLAWDLLTPTGVFLQAWFMADLLTPLMMLSFATFVLSLKGPSSTRKKAFVSVAAIVLIVGQAVYPWTYDESIGEKLPMFLVAFVPALTALGILRVGKGQWSMILSILLLSAASLACRVGFSENKSVPHFGWSHTSAEFKETPGARKLLSYTRRIHQYDKHKMDVYLAIVDSIQYIRPFDKENDVAFWFDMLDPHAIVYDNLACTRCWGYSVLNFNFPNAAEARKFDRTEIRAGQLIAIPSVLADAYGFAKLGLAGIGFGARLVDRRNIKHGVIHFAITLVELETLEKKGRTPTR